MARVKLSEDATIAGVVGSLDNPTEYVRRVFQNMLEFRKEHGDAFVRIGTTGRGILPHYRIEPGELEDYMNGRWMICWAVNGRSHKRMEWGVYDLRGEHWSSQGMTIEALQSLLGELRHFKPAGLLANRARV